MGFENTNSVLVADIGSVHTRLVLIDLVEGQYRLVASSRARTTAEPPLNSVSLGIEHATQTMTHTVGRQLISPEPDQLFMIPERAGHGVDEFLATASAGRPMRVFLVGLTPELSLASGRRVLAGSYVTITNTLSPDDVRSDEEQINAMLHAEPDLIFIVGGTDDGADAILLNLVKKVQMALSLIVRGTMPNVLYAGNPALRQQVKFMLSHYTNVFFAKNVLPSAREEQLFPAQIELALVFDDYRSRSPGGFGEVGRQSQVGVVPTTQGYISAIRYMGELPQKGIGPLYVDVGSANSVIVAGVDRVPHFTIRSDLGVGHHLVSALKAIGTNAVRRWLPFEIDDEALWTYAHNKEMRPITIPMTAQELMIEQAVAREIVRLLVRETRPNWGRGEGKLLPNFQPVIGAGAILTEAQHPGMSALMLLDALQPTDITELHLDPHNLLSALGVVAYLKPLITVQALEAGGMVNLGTAFCPHGRLRWGRDAMKVEIRQEGGRVFSRTVKAGEVWMAPILPGFQVEVRIRLGRGLTINGKRRLRVRVTAGAAGLIFDARGRPFVLPRARDRAEWLLRWQAAMTGREATLTPPAQADGATPAAHPAHAEEEMDALLS